MNNGKNEQFHWPHSNYLSREIGLRPPYSQNYSIIYLFIRLFFLNFLFYKQECSNVFKYLTILSGICSPLISHAPNYYREESYEMTQDANKKNNVVDEISDSQV